MLRRNSVVSLVVLILVVGLLSGVGLAAAKQKVTFWSYAENNILEWEARKADIELFINISFSSLPFQDVGMGG